MKAEEQSSAGCLRYVACQLLLKQRAQLELGYDGWEFLFRRSQCDRDELPQQVKLSLEPEGWCLTAGRSDAALGATWPSQGPEGG